MWKIPQRARASHCGGTEPHLFARKKDVYSLVWVSESICQNIYKVTSKL